MTSRIKIAKRYLLSWFFIDFIAITPRFIEKFQPEEEEEGQKNGVSQIFGLARTTRIGRLLKLVRLLRMMKALK